MHHEDRDYRLDVRRWLALIEDAINREREVILDIRRHLDQHERNERSTKNEQ